MSKLFYTMSVPPKAILVGFKTYASEFEFIEFDGYRRISETNYVGDKFEIILTVLHLTSESYKCRQQKDKATYLNCHSHKVIADITLSPTVRCFRILGKTLFGPFRRPEAPL